MEPVTMAFLVALATPNIQPMPYHDCLALEVANESRCVLVEPPCGGEGEEICFVAEKSAKKKTTYKRKYYTKNGRRYYRLVKQ